jgi:hypothetical protein
MLLKSVAAGVLALGLFGATAFNLPASDTAPIAAIQNEITVSAGVARPTCCAKSAYCCSRKSACCGRTTQLQNDSK